MKNENNSNKEKGKKHEEEENSKEDCTTNMPGLLNCIKDIVPNVNVIEKRDKEMCEINIMGTPGLILKILKI